MRSSDGTVDPRLKRYWEACCSGGRPLRSDDPQWKKALDEAVKISNHVRDSYGGPTFEAHKPGSAVKLPAKYASGYDVILSHHLVLAIEATWADLDFRFHELERLASEIKDEAYRVKLLQTIEELKKSIDQKARAHLRSVP